MSDPAADEAIVRGAETVLGEAPVAIDELAHGARFTATRRVCRVRTATRCAVVKVVSAPSDPTAAGDEYHPTFWRREPQLYEHGLPTAYTDAGIVMATLLGRVDERAATSLWLEDLEGATGSALTAEAYENVARRLGRAQGALAAAGTGDDAFPWSRDFLTDFVSSWNDDAEWDRVDDDDAWTQPLIRDHFAPGLRARLAALCHERHEVVAWSQRLPQTICHHDVWLNNVFEQGDRTALIDWSFAGIGHLGADVGNLVTDSCGDLLQPADLLPAFDAAATAGYRAGLADAGWAGDFRLVRLGMCTMAAKWSFIVPRMLTLAANDAHHVYGAVAADSDALFSTRAAMLDFFTNLAAEAHTIAGELGWQ